MRTLRMCSHAENSHTCHNHPHQLWKAHCAGGLISSSKKTSLISPTHFLGECLAAVPLAPTGLLTWFM